MDTFEHFVRTEPFASREACDLADLIFINEAEYRGLYRENEIPKAPTILKHGPRGADYMADGMTRAAAEAPAVQVVDDTGAGEILAGVYLALVVVRGAARAGKVFLDDGIRRVKVVHEIIEVRAQDWQCGMDAIGVPIAPADVLLQFLVTQKDSAGFHNVPVGLN